MLVGAFFVLVAQAAANESCAGMAYRDQRQIDTKIRVHDLRGVAIDEQNVPVPGVCVGLFTESDHKLIATIRTNDGGIFRFRSISRGTYRLVAECQAFGAANSLVIVGWRGERSIVVRMRTVGIDTTSYVEKSVPR